MAAMVERNCLWCKQLFSVRAANVARGWGKFCSKRCKGLEQESRTHQASLYCQQRNAERWGGRDHGEFRGSHRGGEFQDAHLFSNEDH